MSARSRPIAEPSWGIPAMAQAEPAGPHNSEPACGSERVRVDGEVPAAKTDDRCSPDPCQHTDRYRLVMPFSLRL